MGTKATAVSMAMAAAMCVSGCATRSDDPGVVGYIAYYALTEPFVFSGSAGGVAFRKAHRVELVDKAVSDLRHHDIVVVSAPSGDWIVEIVCKDKGRDAIVTVSLGPRGKARVEGFLYSFPPGTDHAVSKFTADLSDGDEHVFPTGESADGKPLPDLVLRVSR